MHRFVGRRALAGFLSRASASSASPSAAPSCTAHHRAMSAATPSPVEVKILMLHGYTQSGPLFHVKTRALEKLLAKTLAPASLVPALVYPTAPNRLLPRDIPGYQVPAGREAAVGGDYDDDDGGGGDGGGYQPDAWDWFRKDEATGTYRFLAEGMATVARAIRDVGGVDGVCGFSQGGAVAAIVAAALEPGRPVPEGPDGGWVSALRDANQGRSLRFAVSYSGFYSPVDALKWCYEPELSTPTLHYVGSLDTVVDESRSQALIDRCRDPVVVVHPGGHHVPVSKEWAIPLAGFVKQHAPESQPRAGL